MHGLPNWHPLRDHLKDDWLPRLAILKLDYPGKPTAYFTRVR